MLAGLGIEKALSRANSILKRSENLSEGLVLALLVILLLGEIAAVHPFEGSYFNSALRLFIPEHVEDHLEMEYWGATYRQGVSWLNENAEQNARVCAPFFVDLMDYYDSREDITFSENCDEQMTYLIAPTRKNTAFWSWYGAPESEGEGPSLKVQTRDPMTKNRHWTGETIGLKREPVFIISRYSSDLLYIFEFAED
jgi:hypothetical protein